MSQKVSESVQRHQSGEMHCAQAILSTYGPDLGLDEAIALKVASGFGAGVGRTGRICGSVSGAIMVLGLTYNHDDPKGREKIYMLVNKFIDRFIERNGSIKCKEIESI